MNGKHVNVCSTNEHLTSQTCLYSHPKCCLPICTVIKSNKTDVYEDKRILDVDESSMWFSQVQTICKLERWLSSLGNTVFRVMLLLTRILTNPFVSSKISQYDTKAFKYFHIPCMLERSRQFLYFYTVKFSPNLAAFFGWVQCSLTFDLYEPLWCYFMRLKKT